MNNSIEIIQLPHRVDLNIPANEGDIAIVSIDNVGTRGTLNQMVLKEYGYTEKDLPGRESLVNGFSQVSRGKKKEILFVVTVNGGNTNENLKKNLLNALKEFKGWFRGKKLWIPLLGTGDGALSLAESYSIIVNTINEFQNNWPTETLILLSIPNNREGKGLIKLIRGLTSSEPNDFKLENFANEFSNRFYLVGSVWKEQDQLPRFFEQDIWERGQEDDSYSILISEIKSNDILIVKSTYASQDGKSLLRIKAFGIVRGILMIGSRLSVEWVIKDVVFDIEKLGYFRNTVHLIPPDVVSLILIRLNEEQRNALLSNPHLKLKKESIAGLVNDSDSGVDYLGIANDVSAFAKVIAAKSFEPPLAIALFGKWGSGKSFFMRKLKEQIFKLSKNKAEGIYCEGIAHIHFNAWSYMDSNLWASIVTKIFEELNEYISENRKVEIEKKEIEKLLTDKLSIAKEEIGILESKKESVVLQIQSLEEKRKTIAKELDENIKKVKTDTVWQIIETADIEFNAKEKIIEAAKANSTFIQTEAELKKIIPEKYWNDPEKTYQLAKSRITFLKEFFRTEKIKSNVIWLAIILAIIAFVPLILQLFSLYISKANFLIPQAVLSLLLTCGAIWRRAENVYNELQPVVASFWKVKESHENKIQEAKAKFEQQEKALKLEIEKGKSEVLLIQEQIQKAETIKTDLDFRISNAFATEALYSFIDRRSKSEDYKKHLGLISIIRRDFEILNDLFTDHNQEAEKIKNAKEFKDKFKKPLERIILYIDDLDRCPEENVVQVLEAVNLLMAFPLFVVIVGVDSRWVKNSLLKKHSLQFGGNSNGNEIQDASLELIEPSQYLEKIFQIPFHLKDAKDDNVKEMIKNLAQSKPLNSESNHEDYVDRIYVNSGESNNYLEDKFVDPEFKSSDAPENHLSDRPEALILNETEIKLMQDMSEVIGNNPRAVKRFVNIFRIIKAHQGFKYDEDSTNQEISAILFLVALPLGIYKKLIPSVESYLEDESNSLKQFTFYLQPNHKIGTLDIMKHQLNVTLSVKQSFGILQRTPVHIFKKHNSFVRRFSFKEL